MRMSDVEFGAAADAVPAPAASDHDPVRQFIEVVPRPLRFLSVGAVGLITDLAVFTVVLAHGLHPLLARLVSLAVATVVTWRLNRALTFECSGHRPSREVMRYATVAGCAQAVSYVTFAVLVVTVFAATPQLAVIAGAAVGALVSYKGQALFTFRPRPSLLAAQSHPKAAP
ncbi:MAG: GtrA family protein [Xanthobacteraceae bacterium]